MSRSLAASRINCPSSYHPPCMKKWFSMRANATAFARIENHFFMHGGWYDDGQLRRDAARLRDIPGVIVQGRYDMCTPAFTAWDLHKEWPEAGFKICLLYTSPSPRD